jgi:hypothetical protein
MHQFWNNIFALVLFIKAEIESKSSVITFLLLIWSNPHFEGSVISCLKITTSDWRLCLLRYTLPTYSNTTRFVGNGWHIPWFPHENESCWYTNDFAFIQKTVFRNIIFSVCLFRWRCINNKECMFGIAPRVPPHMPLFVAYCECDGWSLITWILFPDVIQSSTADFSRNDNRVLIFLIAYLSTSVSEATSKHHDMLLTIELLNILIIFTYLCFVSLSIILDGTVVLWYMYISQSGYIVGISSTFTSAPSS